MDVLPVRIVLAIFKNGKVERAMLRANFGKMWPHTAVAANVDLAQRRLQYIRGPERGVSLQPPARKMPRRRSVQGQTPWQGRCFSPVAFVHIAGRIAPVFEVGAHT